MQKLLGPIGVLITLSLCVAGGFPALSGTDETDLPFGVIQFGPPDKSGWEQWRRVAADVLTELPRLNACHKKPESCTPAERRFVQILIEAEAQRGIGRIEVVNRRINSAIRYTPDKTQWDVADKWSAPFDADGKGSFETGKGDCEDYAAAKFVALYLVGVPLANMRVVLVHDNVVRLDHAILAVHHEARWLILENRHDELHEDKVYNTFTPLVLVDSQGVGRLARSFRISDQKALTPRALSAVHARHKSAICQSPAE